MLGLQLIGNFQVLLTSNIGPLDTYNGAKYVGEVAPGELQCTETEKFMQNNTEASITITFTVSVCGPATFDTVRQGNNLCKILLLNIFHSPSCVMDVIFLILHIDGPCSTTVSFFTGALLGVARENGKHANLGYYCRNIGNTTREGNRFLHQ